MVQFLIDNYVAVGAIVLAAASEIIGLSPAKSNSIVQLVFSLLGNIFKK